MVSAAPPRLCAGVYKNNQGADEATLCQEAGLRYTTICMIDNYANGIQPDKQLAFSDFAEGVKRNMLVVENIAKWVIKEI